MKRFIKSLLLVILALGTTVPAWGQASTQGKDFWLAATIVCQPPDAKNPAVPYIAISTKEACVVSITDYQGNSVVTQYNTGAVLNQIPLGAGSWTEFGNTNATVRLYDINPSKWYPTTNVTSAGDVYKHADEKNRYGLHVTSDKEISVFVVLRATNSMDASNILPVNAIQSEYYTQDYWPYAKDVATNITMSTILAIEDNTVVDITPKGDTYGKNNSGQMFNITLNKGETYYLMSKAGEQLAGTHIKARNGKKIAVYNGCPLTTVPVMVSARDGMYEQSMPVDYWGTDFIVTRSKNKDGNIIGITASHDGTSVFIDGYYRTTIDRAGDTYYCMMQSSYNPNSKKPGDKPLKDENVYTADVAYIQTSCPCALYSYDTGNAFVYSKDENENLGSGDDRYGDPSSVWISPIQQTIGEITFGTCYTDKTTMHYLNVVTETATCQQTTLAYRNGTSMVDCSNLLEWIVVDGNPKYSYARALISNSDASKNVFTLKNPAGFIAHIYGNGDDESYAYSAGSAAVQQGVVVDGETFTNGYRSDSKFCFGQELEFDAKVGTDVITRVDWNFGDGTTEYYGEPQTTHKYTSPGWYDVVAELYGHRVCTDEDNIGLGKVQFSFRVVRADTILVAPKDSCLSIAKQKEIVEEHGQAYLDSLVANGGRTILNPDAPCYEDKQLSFVKFGMETETVFDSIVRDGVYINGTWYDASTTVEWTVSQPHKCDQHFTCNLTVITCLKMDVKNDSASQHICPLQSLEVEYSKTKGDIKEAWFVVPGVLNEKVTLSNDNKPSNIAALPTESMRKPGNYNGTLYVVDLHCGDTLSFPVDFTVYYPSDIFRYKFNNVMAVYNSGYGGNTGYTFKAYQWYLNGQPIEGATEPVLYLGDGVMFSIGDVVYVVLTDMSGVTIPSCAQTITTVPDYNKPDTSNAPARKKLVNGQFVIEKGNGTFDIYGQKVQ